MSELVKEAGLRSAVAKRMGSNPIPSIAERHIRYSLAVRIGLFHSLDPGSTPGIGIKFGISLQKVLGDQHDQRIHTAITCLS